MTTWIQESLLGMFHDHRHEDEASYLAGRGGLLRLTIAATARDGIEVT